MDIYNMNREEGKTYRKIAKQYGVTPGRIGQIVRDAKGKLNG